MTLAATEPRGDRLGERLLWVDPRAGRYGDARVGDLPELLRPGDLVVVNDAATLPASLAATTRRGEPAEIRLVSAVPEPGPATVADGRFVAVLFGPGDWRTRTEDRPAPPVVREGETLRVGPDLECVIERVSDLSARLVDLRFSAGGPALLRALYRYGRPIP